MGHGTEISNGGMLIDEAFNLGCDARINGKPLSACPYKSKGMRSAFRRGWQDVQRSWGLDEKRRAVKPLPSVRGQAT